MSDKTEYLDSLEWCVLSIIEKYRVILELVAENARLRKHLANVLPFAICSDTCFVGTCFMYQECKDDVTSTCHALIRMKELAHELGVNADYE